MSSKNVLPNDLESARKYIQHISSICYVEKIFISGSRSPKSTKGPHEFSDWDFVIYCNTEFRLPHPRNHLNLLHADISMVYDETQLKRYRKIVEIFPQDKFNILR